MSEEGARRVIYQFHNFSEAHKKSVKAHNYPSIKNCQLLKTVYSCGLYQSLNYRKNADIGFSDK